MGLFSDDEINEAEALVSESWNKESRIEFLKGFEESYKWTKKARNDEISAKAQEFLNEVIKHDYADPSAYERNTYRIKQFGHMFGTLVSLFKYHPNLILNYEDQYTNRLCLLFIKQLKSQSPKYYDFIKKRVIVWADKIKANPTELSPQQSEAFLKFLRGV